MDRGATKGPDPLTMLMNLDLAVACPLCCTIYLPVMNYKAPVINNLAGTAHGMT